MRTDDPCRIHEPTLAALDEYAELALDADAVDAARAHLAGCPRCQARRRMWARLDDALRDALAPAAVTPALTTADLLTAIGADHEPSERRTPMLSVIYMRDEEAMDDEHASATSSTTETPPAENCKPAFALLPSLALTHRQPSWRRALTGLTAVVAAAALIAAIAGAMTLTGHLRGARSANLANATQTAQAQPVVQQQARIAGIAFDSSADGWVVFGDGSNNAIFYHYQDGKLTKSFTESKMGAPAVTLWPFAPNNIWAFMGGGSGVYHYDGANWTQQTLPAPPNSDGIGAPLAMRMVSPTQGWAIGDAFISSVGAQKLVQVFYHYDGSAWRIDPADSQASASGYTVQSVQNEPNSYTSNQIQLTGISATPDGDVWASGYIQYQNPNSCCISDATGYLYHRVNGVWRLAQLMPHYELDGIQMTGRRSGWIIGKKYETHKNISTIPMTISGETLVVLGWNGARWSPVSVPQLDQTHLGLQFTQIAATSPSNVWIVGNSSGTTYTSGSSYASDATYLIHYDGVRWSRASLPQIAAIDLTPGVINQASYDAIALTSSGDLWMAGGLAAESDGNYRWRSLLYHYSNGQWTSVSLPKV